MYSELTMELPLAVGSYRQQHLHLFLSNWQKSSTSGPVGDPCFVNICTQTQMRDTQLFFKNRFNQDEKRELYFFNPHTFPFLMQVQTSTHSTRNRRFKFSERYHCWFWIKRSEEALSGERCVNADETQYQSSKLHLSPILSASLLSRSIFYNLCALTLNPLAYNTAFFHTGGCL